MFDLLGRTAHVVSDGDTVRHSGCLVGGGDVQDPVGVNVEGDLDLRNTAGGRGDTGEPEPADEIVAVGVGMLAFINLDEHTGLVVSIGGEDFGLLGGDGSVSPDKGSHEITSNLDTEGLRIHVEPEQVLDPFRGISQENGGLYGGPTCNCLVRVDALAESLPAEEIGNGLDYAGDAGRTTDQDDLVDIGLINFRIMEDLLDWFKSAFEQVLAQLFEMATGEGCVKVDVLKKILDLDGGGGSGGEGSLGTLAGSTETAESPRIAGEVPLVLVE